MKHASSFRCDARNALRGKWIIAIIAGIIVSLLGGEIIGTASTMSITYEESSQQEIDDTEEIIESI